jgi:hypothetical protein
MFGVIGTNMYGWYGSGGKIGLTRTTIFQPPPEPPIFSPTDISDCVLWLDANDTSTIDVNGDLSGANVNRVMKWFDKAKPSNQNYYRHVGNPATSGLYNTHTMNQLNTVYFESNAYMNHEGGGVTFNFQARTFFYVGKPLTDLSGAANPYIGWYNTDTFEVGVGYMNTGMSYDSMTGLHSFAMCENAQTCGIVFDLSNNPLNQRMIVMFAQTDQIDLSGNAGSYDTINQTLANSDPADLYATGQSQYILNSPSYGTAQDIAEIIMYGRLLSPEEQIKVLEYLADKWNLSGPTGDTVYIQGPPVIKELEVALAPPEGKEEPFYPTYGYAIYGQFDEGFPNWFWCDENQNVESPPVLITNYTGSTGDRDSQTYTILGSFYA